MTGRFNAVRLHRALALALCLFAVPHLMGHLAGLWGQAAFDAVQAALRPHYRNALVEPALFAVALGQLGLGLWLMVRRGRRGLRGRLLRWQTLNGGVFALFLAQHLSALALARWGFGLDTTFWWPASVASTWPFTLYFWPYYLLGVLAFVLHAGIGLALVLRRAGKARAGRAVIWAAALGGSGLALAILLGISGLLRPIDLPAAWQAYLALFLPAGGS